MSRYYFDEKKRFVIEGYNNTKPFSSFLPGIAGIKGTPIWFFYVNRGQCAASFGIENKDGAVMEFYPANKSYQFTPLYGFRTFIKKGGNVIEPFSIDNKTNAKEKLLISKNEFEINWKSEIDGLNVNVSYFAIPDEEYGAMVRTLEIENTSDAASELEILDGLPAILPYGIDNKAYKELGNTLKAWMEVENLENKIPFYKIRGGTGDSAEVTIIEKGHFLMAFDGTTGEHISPIVDSETIFGQNTAMTSATEFISTPIDELAKKPQVTVNKVACGFSWKKKIVQPGEKLTLVMIIGTTDNIELINRKKYEIGTLEFIRRKKGDASALIDNLTDNIECRTSQPLFDAYARQCYLDNVMRGGIPLLLGQDNKKVYHVFSRKHGDLERDYNFFSLEAGFYSQGNGNFRDANQNRRCDIYFEPAVKDFNIKMFMSLIQLDGYNPLVVKGCSFILDIEKNSLLLESAEENSKEKLSHFFEKPYTPGKYYSFIRNENIELKEPADLFLAKIINVSEQNFEADFGEGYWIDHWTYNMDHIDTYLTVFPDKKEELLFNEKDYTYYDSPAKVLPRSHKYVFAGGKGRQYDAVDEHNEKKRKLMSMRKEKQSQARTAAGEIYKTTLYEKLLNLALNKFACMDPAGIGVEMEAGKPGWNDSMNGLPGMFASGVSETFELYRIIKFLKRSSMEFDGKLLEIPDEMAELMESAENSLNSYNDSGSESKDFIYWDNMASARELYREKTEFGLSGKYRQYMTSSIALLLDKIEKKLNRAIEKAENAGNGLYPTYLYFDVSDYEFITNELGNIQKNHKGYPRIKAKEFKMSVLPYFLEGPAKAMKILDNKEKAEILYTKIKSSGLYDKKLKMYKMSDSLNSMGYDIGRARSFTPGWLENESVFLHMEYKYILSMLASGLYDEYFSDMKELLIPFLSPETYGRSTLENSSFIASSANPDPATHGTGYVARLSGSTAEFINMWFIMMAGKKPFDYVDGELTFNLEPILPGWMFDSNGEIEFKLFGTISVKYINPGRKNTFGVNGAKTATIEIEANDGAIGKYNAALKGNDAENVRNKGVKRITAVLL